MEHDSYRLVKHGVQVSRHLLLVRGSIPLLVTKFYYIMANNSKSDFTLEQAIEIQARQLDEWKIVLKASVHKELVKHAKAVNMGVTNPYEIFRGTTMSCWVQNYMLKGTNRMFIGFI